MQARIEKIVFGGQGLARLEDGRACPQGLADSDSDGRRVVFVWNALPGELVELDIVKKKKDHLEAIATRILESSPERIEPKEEIFLSTSPWQMCHFEAEKKYKIEMAQEIYQRTGGLEREDPIEMVGDDRQYGYRNKMEFSFFEDEAGKIDLAFFMRGRRRKLAVEGSLLAEEAINATANHVLEWIRTTQMTTYNLKSLVVRSNGAGKAIAALFIKDRLSFEDYPAVTDTMEGFQLYYSTHKSPASVPTAKLYETGKDHLVANIRGRQLKFGLLSFFQINIPVFEQALEDISQFVDPSKDFVDFYSGVGAIGIPLAAQGKRVFMVDNNEEAIEYANQNIEVNGLSNAMAQCIPSEDITELISPERNIIFDPPRAGLHKKVVNRVLEVLPETIIYMSCNLSTHARDIQLLSEKYDVAFLKLYNFFPRTPHVEGLAVLKLK